MLPYPERGSIRENGGNAVAGGEDIPIAKWPLGEQNVSAAGEFVDFEGIAPKRFMSMLEVPDRFLVIGGVKHKILSATLSLHTPWAQLRLRKMGSGA